MTEHYNFYMIQLQFLRISITTFSYLICFYTCQKINKLELATDSMTKSHHTPTLSDIFYLQYNIRFFSGWNIDCSLSIYYIHCNQLNEIFGVLSIIVLLISLNSRSKYYRFNTEWYLMKNLFSTERKTIFTKVAFKNWQKKFNKQLRKSVVF